MAQAQRTLAEQSQNRFLLGLGVSHAPLVEGLRGLPYDKPLSTMRTYLEAMATSPYLAPAPNEEPPTVLAALGPKMLELAAVATDGAHPYWTTPEHTATAREILGPDRLLCVEQKVALSTDADTARAAAREALAMYADLPNYRNNWFRLGFTEEDVADGGSDRLIDALVGWGDEDAIRARITAHHDAGADHVCIQPLPAGGQPGEVAWDVLEALAPGG
jgi:probable F420-dependent oxidoreductase